ncbi:TdeIII family type II restriction endonuclease [Aeromonas veronii]|uniref:TdeIII family type II restriction endonuclease n=1 Tax=Aeromonas veronii TaxID=654 RepID=UPI001F4033F2|nr:TdeIII family type II restriction endonuclease [Aeromonas veronii]MCF5900926.1 TdeIII family type II restriction endonuclease [Aeromonas veronii]
MAINWSKAVRDDIKKILSECVRGALDRTNKKIESEKSHKPFHSALLTDAIVKVSSFERSFSTSFGQGPIEKISEIVAKGNGFEAQRQKVSMVNLHQGAVDEIERICAALRRGSQIPNWKQEITSVTSFNMGNVVVRRVITDLWLKKNEQEHFISIKTVTPNLDQSEIAKKDMLILKAGDRNCKTYFGLYYNPNGSKRSDYKHSFPMKLFDMHKDECVLIGKDYWDFLGGIGAYEYLLEIFSEVGEETKASLLDY